MSYHFATFKKPTLPEHLYLYPVVIPIPKVQPFTTDCFPWTRTTRVKWILIQHYLLVPFSKILSFLLLFHKIWIMVGVNYVQFEPTFAANLKKTVFWSQSFAPSPKLRPQSHSESNSQPITVFDTKSWDSHVNILTFTYLSSSISGGPIKTFCRDVGSLVREIPIHQKCLFISGAPWLNHPKWRQTN